MGDDRVGDAVRQGSMSAPRRSWAPVSLGHLRLRRSPQEARRGTAPDHFGRPSTLVLVPTRSTIRANHSPRKPACRRSPKGSTAAHLPHRGTDREFSHRNGGRSTLRWPAALSCSVTTPRRPHDGPFPLASETEDPLGLLWFHRRCDIVRRLDSVPYVGVRPLVEVAVGALRASKPGVSLGSRLW